MRRDRALRRTKCCRTETGHFSSVHSPSLSSLQGFGRLPLLRGTPVCFWQHLRCISPFRASCRILYCFASCVGEQVLSYIRDAKMPKGVWENLKKIFAASTTARKLQLRQELSNLRQRNLSVADYTSKIKDICDSLASIEVNIEESEMV